MKLSIITVNLNNLEGLKKTYESVVSQTFTDYEWLVIDGGSTDGSREFIEQHQDKFAYWCSEPDKGIYNAMNKGIVRAKGEYLNFMNSGDCFAFEETLTLVFNSEEMTADILYGYVMKGNKNGKCFRFCTMKPDIRWYDLFLEALPHQATFIKKAMFSKVGLYDEQCKIVSDWKWFVSAMLDYKATYGFLPYRIAVVQEGGISSTNNCTLEKLKERKKLFPDYITEEEVSDMVILSIVKRTKITRFLYKIVKLMALQINSLKQKHIK